MQDDALTVRHRRLLSGARDKIHLLGEYFDVQTDILTLLLATTTVTLVVWALSVEVGTTFQVMRLVTTILVLVVNLLCAMAYRTIYAYGVFHRGAALTELSGALAQ